MRACALKGLSLARTLEVLFNVGLLSISVKLLTREVSKSPERSGRRRPVFRGKDVSRFITTALVGVEPCCRRVCFSHYLSSVS